MTKVTKENNFNEKYTTTNQYFITEKETNAKTNTIIENRSPNNINLLSTEGHQSNLNATTTVYKSLYPEGQ